MFRPPFTFRKSSWRDSGGARESARRTSPRAFDSNASKYRREFGENPRRLADIALWIKGESCGINRIACNFTDCFQCTEKPFAHCRPARRNAGAAMIFRAVFWIGLVALLMPREPDLGLGRPAPAIDPGAGSEVAAWAASKIDPRLASDPQLLCRANPAACSAGAGLVENVRTAALQSLAQVKADLRDNERRR
ncbi:MAG: hypothetical protein JO261_11840 [Alphaproteobacteria bacterium]|nr:hypothetical protein [Alphaproteobacteria bacterium]